MSAPDLLAAIAARKQVEVASLRCAEPAIWATAETLAPAHDLSTLRGGTVIAEIKRRSPSGGALRETIEVAEIAAGYAGAGAAAVSVLTDRVDFGGSLDDLAAAAKAVAIPLLRKDFIVDPVQIAEARVAGADWVLLIVTMLGTEMLDRCLAAAHRCGAGAIVEVHDDEEARRAVDAGAVCIGINNRDLNTLRTDLATFARVRNLLPRDVICVAESGVRAPAEAARLVAEGADAVLVGEALMRAASPADACAAMVVAVRAQARR